jgi:two-component system chemotaxis response regulator CheB
MVVDDSITVRKRLVELLAADPEVEVVAEAVDGRQAVDKCLELRPDVITMDMTLPVMSGLAATAHIMAHSPTPILIVSSAGNRGTLFTMYDALAAGAVDVLEKPSEDEAAAGEDRDRPGGWETKFVAAVKLVARIRVITRHSARTRTVGQRFDVTPPLAAADPRPAASRAHALIALGASTGGPGAIVEVLRALPAVFPLPILLVLHIGQPFGRAFAEWLHDQTGRAVAYPVDGEPTSGTAGRVIMAPPDCHLVVRAGRLHLTADPERHSCRPSIDVLFESVAREVGAAATGCLLTGMGRDGAAGLLEIRRAGGLTIAQDEATSVVYGMPREAVLLGAAERVLPLAEIGPALARREPPRGAGL